MKVTEPIEQTITQSNEQSIILDLDSSEEGTLSKDEPDFIDGINMDKNK
jgi:hypothetical protein